MTQTQEISMLARFLSSLTEYEIGFVDGFQQRLIVDRQTQAKEKPKQQPKPVKA